MKHGFELFLLTGVAEGWLEGWYTTWVIGGMRVTSTAAAAVAP